VVRSSSISGDVYGLEPGARGAADAAKKRRSSLGAKMVAIVGLSQWSRSTLQLSQPEGGPKKLRSNIRRSTETGIAVEMRSRVTRQGSRDSTDGSTNSGGSDGMFIFPATRLAAESHFSNFLDGLGPAQVVGRQTLATPPMGERGRPGCPDPVGALGAGGTGLLPWEGAAIEEGAAGGRGLQSFMGMAQIALEELDLPGAVAGWYKLFPTASLADSSLGPLARRLSQSSLESSPSPCGP
ncbi:RIMS3 protein, partial [Eudromia elegans]|nr:RIMS3 protein [Eudromia elegans]